MDSTSGPATQKIAVFTQVGNARKHSGRPVMVWIYGGGLIAGEANDTMRASL
jgi:carboxylesterase type B